MNYTQSRNNTNNSIIPLRPNAAASVRGYGLKLVGGDML